MFENKKISENRIRAKADIGVSLNDMMQSEQDMSFVHSKLEKLDRAIPESEHLSSEYLLKRAKEKKKSFSVRTVVMAASAAAVVLIIGVAAAASGISFKETDSNDMAMDQEMTYSSSTVIMDDAKEEEGEPETEWKGEETEDTPAVEEDAENGMNGNAQDNVYAAGSYSELLRVVEGAAKDFAHIITPVSGKTESDNDSGIIGSVVSQMNVEFILQTDAEYSTVKEIILSGNKTNVITSGSKRVYAVSSEEMGALVGIDDAATGELMSVIRLDAGEKIKQLLLRDEILIIISEVSKEVEEETIGAFDAAVINVFNISDGYLPSKVERYASEGDLFTVLTDSSGIYVVVNRFAVGEMNMTTMEIEGMDYVPMVLCGDTYYRIAPSNIYITGTMASMDYLIMFQIGDEEMRAYAYLGTADPLVAVNYLIEKFK